MSAPANGHIQPRCSNTSDGVAYKIQPGECSAQCNGNEPVVFQAQERDYIDSHREVSPLTQAEDAIVLDNSHMTMDDQMVWIRNVISERFGC